VAETLGALPARAQKRDFTAELAKVTFPEKPFNETYRIQTQIDKGEVRVYWPTRGAGDHRHSQLLFALASIFEERLRAQVREKMGASYSPSVQSNRGEATPNFGYIEAGCTVDPRQARQVQDLIVQIGDELARNGVKKEELNRIRKVKLNDARQLQRNNMYWLTTVLAQAQENPETLNPVRTLRSDIESISVEELSELARTYLGATRASRVLVLPEGKE